MRPKFSPHILIALALALLVLPLRWILAWAAASAFHEGCHLLALWLCGGKTYGFEFGIDGAKLRVGDLSAPKEILCALAGPMGSLLLVLLARWIPATAVCAAFQLCWNLLPVYPMDGGRMLRGIASLLMEPPAAHKLCRAVEWLCLAAVTGGAIYAAFWLRLGLIPLLFAAILFLKVKNTCKPAAEAVQ